MYDVIVIGGGPAGVTAALRARELGATVALVERARLGGTCTNDGCVPTRVLAKAARLVRDADQFAEYGIDMPAPDIDFARVMERAQQVVYQVHEKKQLLAHLRAVQADVFDNTGTAHFVDAHRLRLGDGRELEAHHFVICAGGHARRATFPGSDLALLHSDIWRLRELPRSVAIVGAGATGCQLGSILDAFGSKVIIMDRSSRLVPPEDVIVSETLMESFIGRGIELIMGMTDIERIERKDGQLEVSIAVPGGVEKRLVDAVMLSVGWPGNLESLNISAAGVSAKGAYVDVDDTLRTSAPHIYAAGDITGRMMLVQTASQQARIAVENALLPESVADNNRVVPHGGFTDPEYASVGLTEEMARQSADCVVAVVPYADMDRAVIDDRTVGYCKLIVERGSRHIVGAHVVGEQAVEVVHIVATAMAAQMPIEGLAELDFAYPTISAIIGLAARQIARDLNVIPVVPQWRALIRERIAEWERRLDFDDNA